MMNTKSHIGLRKLFCLLIAVAVSVSGATIANAAISIAESPIFSLDAYRAFGEPSSGEGQSGTFAIDGRRMNRAWADSGVFGIWSFGTTVIVHGLSVGGELNGDEWMFDMARAIYAKAQTGRVLVLSMENNSFTSCPGVTTDGNVDGETIVVFDWASHSNDIVDLISLDLGEGWREAAGEALFSSLMKLGVADRPIHLIGASLGGIVITHTARRLEAVGKAVDQMTFLDGEDEPVLDGVGLDLGTIGQVPGDEVAVFGGVSFADNYWGDGTDYPVYTIPPHHLFLQGRDVDGAASFRLAGQGHNDIPVWYAGTIADATTEGYALSRYGSRYRDRADLCATGDRREIGDCPAVFNGHFEIGNADFWQGFPGYTDAPKIIDDAEAPGNRAAQLSFTNARFTHQPVYVPAGARYVSFLLSLRDPSSDDELEISFNGHLLGTPIALSSLPGGFVEFQRDITAYRGEVGELSFGINPHGVVTSTVWIDNINIVLAAWPIPGDANGDCKVNVLDLIWVRNRLGTDVNSNDNWTADVNGDGKVNVLDLIFVRNNLNAKCE